MSKMKKDDHNRNVKRERFIMISTSALVLTVLTVSGAYVRNRDRNSMDNGYTLDFSALEDRADEKLREITKNRSDGSRQPEQAQGSEGAAAKEGAPLKAGSDEVKIPGLTEEIDSPIVKKNDKAGVDQSGSKGMSEGTDLAGKKEKSSKQNAKQEVKQTPVQEYFPEDVPLVIEESSVAEASAPEQAVSGQAVAEEELHFNGEAFVKPVSGEPLIEYSMDHSVYFATLDQYKYNPAIIFSATQGEAVCACAAGRVMNVHQDPELGQTLVLDLGDGYQAIYGQLENVEVPIGSTVSAGRKLASVASPTKYYSVEGHNLYFQLLKDGKSIDPGQFLR